MLRAAEEFMYLYDTGGGTLTLRSLYVFKGRASFGCGSYITNAPIVVIELSFFSDCQATAGYDGGGAILPSLGTLNIIAVWFSSASRQSSVNQKHLYIVEDSPKHFSITGAINLPQVDATASKLVRDSLLGLVRGGKIEVREDSVRRGVWEDTRLKRGG